METAGDLIKDALTEITVLGAEASVESVDAQTGIRYLNRMMAAFDADSIDLGYTEVSSLADDVTIPAGANEAIVPQLAARLWGQYATGKPIPPDLVGRAKYGKEVLRVLTFSIAATEFPSTLPVGSGNEGDASWNEHFYPDLESEILAETTGSIGLEDGTV